jgi:hypothetical protein
VAHVDDDMLKGFAALMEAIHTDREAVLNDPDKALKDVPDQAQSVIRGMSELELLVLAHVDERMKQAGFTIRGEHGIEGEMV